MWILSESHFDILESFQAEIGKCILGVSKYYSNTSTLIGLHWPSVKERVLIRKLTFLTKLLERDDVLSSCFRTLASINVYDISFVQQCRVLEQQPVTGFLELCLQNPTNAASIVHEAKSEILEKDWNCIIQDSRSHHSLAIVSATVVIASSWNRTWDEALEYGVRGTKLMQGLFGALARPTFGDKASPHCNETISSSYPEHLFTKHLTDYNVATVVMWLEDKDFNNLLKLADTIITSMKFYLSSHSQVSLSSYFILFIYF